MKSLVVFYSKTGNTRKLGQRIAEQLKSDIDEIIDKKSRKGVFGFLGSCSDALRKRPTEIEYTKKPDDYDFVVIGTPVWAGTMTPAVRTYINENKFRNVAFFCTFGGSAGKTFTNMEKVTKKPAAVIGIKDKQVESADVKEYCEKIKYTHY